MKRRRLKPRDGIAHYHLMSRTVNGEKFLGAAEKEFLRKLIRRVAEFSGIRVLTFAILDNHYHVLVEVPPPSDEVSDAEIVRRYGVLYPKPTPWQPMPPTVLAKHLAENGTEGKRLRDGLLRRMHDVSWFMKTVNQRFSKWFNRTHERFGPLWCDRFKSVLVEGERHALRTVAAYIDLNPVRAGLVADPKDYRFSGYGEAVAGRRAAREGLSGVDQSLAGYRQTLYGVGSESKEGKATIPVAEARTVIESERGNLPLSEALRCRFRFFTEGIVLGSASFVEESAQPVASRRTRPARARPVAGTAWGGLTVLSGSRKG